MNSTFILLICKHLQEEVILDPVGAARKKLRKNKAKSEASKRISGQKKRSVAKIFN